MYSEHKLGSLAMILTTFLLLSFVFLGKGCQQRNLQTFDNCIKNHGVAECTLALKGGF